MTTPRILSSKSEYHPFFALQQDLLEKTDGAQHPYSFIRLHTNAAVILAQDSEGRWLLTREYRHPTGQRLLGCPGGRLEPGEDPYEGALREFQEETGYRAEELVAIGSSYPISGLTDQRIYYFFAPKIFSLGSQKLDPFEWIEIEWKTPEELDEELRTSSHVDGILCTALFHYGLYRKKL